MRALLYKDRLILWRRMRLIFLLILVFGAVPDEFQNIFAVVYGAMIPISGLSVDESSKWNEYAAMLPYSTRELVLSKYVLGWGCVGLTVLLVGTVQTVIRAVMHNPPLDWRMLGMAACVALLVMALTLPLAFRFGLDRARVITVVLVALVCGSASGLASAWKVEGPVPVLLLPVMIVVTVVVTALSVLASIRLYTKRAY